MFMLYARVAICRRVLVFAHVEDVGGGLDLTQADGGRGHDGADGQEPHVGEVLRLEERHTPGRVSGTTLFVPTGAHRREEKREKRGAIKRGVRHTSGGCGDRRSLP